MQMGMKMKSNTEKKKINFSDSKKVILAHFLGGWKSNSQMGLPLMWIGQLKQNGNIANEALGHISYKMGYTLEGSGFDMHVAVQKDLTAVLSCGSTGPSRAYRNQQKILDILSDDPGNSCPCLTSFRWEDFQRFLSLAATATY